jgi:hypothetical protein
MFPAHLVKKAAARQSYEQLRDVANHGPGVRPDVKLAPTAKKLADKLVAQAFHPK